MTLNTAATLPLVPVSETAPSLSTETSTLASPDYVAYVGIDWADRKHDIALYDCATETWEESVIQSHPQAILDWVNKLRARYGDDKIAVALEQKRGPLLYALCQYDNLVLFPHHSSLISLRYSIGLRIRTPAFSAPSSSSWAMSKRPRPLARTH